MFAVATQSGGGDRIETGVLKKNGVTEHAKRVAEKTRSQRFGRVSLPSAFRSKANPIGASR
jgi:hypothetical protein